VPIDATSGLVPGLFAKVVGSINAVVSDGAGGWFIGGSFTSVGGVARSNLAHILADNTVSDWNPGASFAVYALAQSGSTLYVGGDFSIIAGQPRSRIAALDATTGQATPWDPSANLAVQTLAVSGSVVYAGGNFNTIGGQTRARLAALDATTGAATSWNPNPTGGTSGTYVFAIAVSGSTVYVGGAFSTIGFQFRNNIAALDATTGAATSWNPNASGGNTSTVYALAVSGSVVYAAGGFGAIGGQPRAGVAALDATTGALLPAWNPAAGTGPFSSLVRAMALNGTTLYIGGDFTSVGAQNRRCIAALDAATGYATGWDPNCGGQVRALAASGSTVFAGGGFVSIGGVNRNRIAALDLTTGIPTAWNPNATNNSVTCLAVSGSIVYAGGSFSQIGGQNRSCIAALDAATGNATAWNPISQSAVNALVVSGSTVYVGGQFFAIGGQQRNRIAALDATTGNATAWNPNAGSTVNALAVNGSTVYAGGAFATIGGQTRNSIAALDAATGNATAWNPTAGGGVSAIAVDGSTVYVGGRFPFVGGAVRNNIAALDAVTGNATPWDPNANGAVSALLVDGSVIYVGGGSECCGSFDQIGGQPRIELAALDATTGLALGWNPNVNSFTTVFGLAINGSNLYAVGSFTSVNGLPIQYLAGISKATVVGVTPRFTTSALRIESRPNPIRGSAGILFSLPRDTDVTLSIYDVAGREVTRLVNGKRYDAGSHEVRFDGRGLPNGLYVCLLRAGGLTATGHLALIR
jgi:hypothetical protein